MAPSEPPRSDALSFDLEELLARIEKRSARIGVVGLGYIGLPLLRTAAERGFYALGFDIDRGKVETINAGRSYIRHIGEESIARLRRLGRLEASADVARISETDALLLCLPTPLTPRREPDLSFVAGTAEAIARHLRRGQLVVLQSTSWPGTTCEFLRPLLEKSGLFSNRDFLLAYSPEREDPGNPDFATADIPKVVAGDGAAALEAASALYGALTLRTVPVSSPATAEAVKLTENIFRAVNIALVNELKTIYEAMGIDVWEVIEAAKTKPFGYMPFYPGPGLGGHCIPIDPFYLAAKAREFDLSARFIELAGEINTAMPARVVAKAGAALSQRLGRALKGARVLVLGLAYKKNIDDTRESPGLKIIELLLRGGAEVSYHDPFLAELPVTRRHGALAGRRSIPLESSTLSAFDMAIICTDHDGVDYRLLLAHCPLVVDTRNVCARLHLSPSRVVKA